MLNVIQPVGRSLSTIVHLATVPERIERRLQFFTDPAYASVCWSDSARHKQFANGSMTRVGEVFGDVGLFAAPRLALECAECHGVAGRRTFAFTLDRRRRCDEEKPRP